MNERLEILLGQALDSAVPETWTTLTPKQFAKLSEKFADLIVDECIQAASKAQSLEAAAMIKQHFAVER